MIGGSMCRSCTVELTGTELAHQARAAVAARRMRAGFRKFSKKNSCNARARRGRAGLKGPRPDLTMTGRCDYYSSAGSSNIKIRTSSPYKAKFAIYGDEVRILIFDDPAEL